MAPHATNGNSVVTSMAARVQDISGGVQKIQNVADWEQQIQAHHFEFAMSVATDDWSYFTAHRLQTAVSGVDHVKSMVKALDADPTTSDPTAVSQDIKNSLGSTNVRAVNTTQTSMDNFKDTITSIQNDPNAANRKPDWQLKIEADAEKQKAAAVAAIDSAKDEAIKVINAAPEPVRPAAAGLYMQATSIVAGVFQTFTNSVKNVLGKVADFFVGIFTSVTNAWNAVKNTVSGAISSIGSLFGGIFSLDVETTTTPVPNGLEKKSNSSSFTGQLKWPAEVRLATATRALEYVQDTLTEKGYKISTQEINKTDREIASKTVFTTTTTMSSPSLLDDLSAVWKTCVSVLGNSDGHWIPGGIIV